VRHDLLKAKAWISKCPFLQTCVRIDARLSSVNAEAQLFRISL